MFQSLPRLWKYLCLPTPPTFPRKPEIVFNWNSTSKTDYLCSTWVHFEITLALGGPGTRSRNPRRAGEGKYTEYFSSFTSLMPKKFGQTLTSSHLQNVLAVRGSSPKIYLEMKPKKRLHRGLENMDWGQYFTIDYAKYWKVNKSSHTSPPIRKCGLNWWLRLKHQTENFLFFNPLFLPGTSINATKHIIQDLPYVYEKGKVGWIKMTHDFPRPNNVFAVSK